MNDKPSAPVFRIVFLATGGTIEKSYDAHMGHLTLARSVIDDLVAGLVQPDIELRIERVMSIDSLEMGSAERETLVESLATELTDDTSDAVVITHGTDTLADTACVLAARFPALDRPVLLTGAMLPFRTADSDGFQNVAQSIMAARLLSPGVYAVFHSRVIEATRIVKDYQRLTFVERPL